MAVYKFTPERLDPYSPARLELDARDEADLIDAKHDLMNYVIDAKVDEIKDMCGVDELAAAVEAMNNLIKGLHRAPARELPVEVIPYISPDDVIVSKLTNLALSMVDASDFEVTIQEIEPKYGSYSSHEEFNKQLLRGEFNGLAFSVQPHTPGTLNDFAEHDTLGYLSADGTFEPVVTVLNDDYYPRSAVATTALMAPAGEG